MTPENIMLSEIRQTQKDKYLTPLMWDTYNKQRHRDGELPGAEGMKAVFAGWFDSLDDGNVWRQLTVHNNVNMPNANAPDT